MTLAGNALHHVAGAIVPALAALATVPIVMAHLGTTTFGILVLVMSLVGTASLLDLNVGTAATKLIAEYRAQGRDDAVAAVLTMSLAVSTVVGLVGAVVLAMLAEPLVDRVFAVPPEAAPAAVQALRWAGIGFAVTQLQGALQGAMHALQRFDLAGGAEAVFGTAASLATVAAAAWGGGLVAIVVARTVVSLLHGAWLAHRLWRLVPRSGHAFAGSWPALRRRLAAFSGWASLSRFAAVTAAHGDKLIIGALADARAVALYAVPFTLVLRVFGLAYRLSQVMFPRASELAAQQRTEQLKQVHLDAGRVLTFVNAAIGVWLVALAPEWLHHWAGAEFGGAAVAVMVCLAAVAVVDSFTQLPSLVNDGLGHPRFTGMAAVLRAVAGLAAVAWGVQVAGIVGAAAVQAAVGTLAAALTVWALHRWTVPVALGDVWRRSWKPSLPLLLAVPALGILSVQREVLGRAGFAGWALALALGLAAYGWWAVLTDAQRRRLRLTARRAALGGQP